ncbi:MAG: hypothetical protein JWO82_2166, partial [Akkermansiaceae bacterium]|nr:hypothetical protein [Akkermansiaceae bacterium]
MKWPLLPLLFCSAVVPLNATPKKRSPDEVLVVVNGDSPVSLAIGKDYASKRGVKHGLVIHCPDSAVSADNETIAYEDYRTLVEAPLEAYLKEHPGIDFIVLTKGVPLRIKGGDTGNKEDNNIASPSVDSTLAALDYDKLPEAKRYHFTNHDPTGALGCAWANRYWNTDEPFSHAKFGGYLVSRLDGYTQADAMALVTRSLASDGKPPRGKFLLDAQSDFGMGDKAEFPQLSIPLEIPDEAPWSGFNADMSRAAEVLEARGIACELDATPDFVGNRKDLAGYYSWGSNDPHATDEAYQSLKFAPGSISDTAVSTCARTFLPTSGGQSLTADLIAHGLTAAKGYCNEPYLQANS